MNDDDGGILWALAAHFLVLSLVAVGGANAVIPEMHRQAVEIGGWMTGRQFADLFAIAQVAPGPNIILVTLIGFHTAGIVGGAVATAAMCVPSCLLAFGVDRTWQHFQKARWRIILQAGIVPISVGLVAAGAAIIAGAAGIGWVAFAIMGATCAFAYFTRYHPLWMFAAAAALGYAGLV